MRLQQHSIMKNCDKITKVAALITVTIGIIIIPIIDSSCLTLTGTKAEKYRSAVYTKVTWHVATITPSCSVLRWMVHYDAVSPVLINKNRNDSSGNAVNQSYIQVYPNFEYQIFVEAITNQGSAKSPVITYHAPKAVPSKAPGRVRMTSKTHDTISITWDKLSIFSTNGNVLGYKIYYRQVGGTQPMSVNVTGENTLTAVLQGLKPSTDYEIVVQCVNDVGPGRTSNPWLRVRTNPRPTTTTTTSTTSTTTTPTTTTTTTTASTTTTTTTTSPTTTTSTTSTKSTRTAISKSIVSATVPISKYILTSSPSAHLASTKPTTITVSTGTPQTVLRSTTLTQPSVTEAVSKTPRNGSTTTNGSEADDDKILGLDIWMIVAIAAGAFLLLLLLSVLICCCCRCCCFEEAAVGAKKQEEERVFSKRKMDEIFTERHTRSDDRRSRTKSVVSLDSIDENGVNEIKHKPRGMRLVSVDSHHSLDGVPILIPPSASKQSTRLSTPMAKTTGTQYERINTTPRAKATGTQYENLVERYVYPTQKSKSFGTQYECIEEEETTKEVGTITDRRGSLPPSAPSVMTNSSSRTPRTLKVVAPLSLQPETIIQPVLAKTVDASTSAMSSPERRFKSADAQTDLSVFKQPTPRPFSVSTVAKSTEYPAPTILKSNDSDTTLPVSMYDTSKSMITSSVNVPSERGIEQKVPFSDIASCPTALPFRKQDFPNSRDRSLLRYPSKAASHPVTIWDIPLKPFPGSISSYPSKDVEEQSPPPISRIEYNTIYDNRVSNTDNTYIHNFLEGSKKMANKPRVSRPPRLPTIPANVQSPRALYDPFLDGEPQSSIKPGTDKQTTFNNIPEVTGPEARATLLEPLALKDSTDC